MTTQRYIYEFFKVSERGVVFLKNQDVTPIQMKELCTRISEAAGCVRSPILFDIRLLMSAI
jgi:hypothetical protein